MPTSSVLASNNREWSQTAQPWTSLCIAASNGWSSLATHRGNGYALRACHLMMMKMNDDGKNLRPLTETAIPVAQPTAQMWFTTKRQNTYQRDLLRSVNAESNAGIAVGRVCRDAYTSLIVATSHAAAAVRVSVSPPNADLTPTSVSFIADESFSIWLMWLELLRSSRRRSVFSRWRFNTRFISSSYDACDAMVSTYEQQYNDFCLLFKPASFFVQITPS